MADWKMITDSKNVHFNWRVRLPKAPNFERRTDFGKKNSTWATEPPIAPKAWRLKEQNWGCCSPFWPLILDVNVASDNYPKFGVHKNDPNPFVILYSKSPKDLWGSPATHWHDRQSNMDSRNKLLAPSRYGGSAKPITGFWDDPFITFTISIHSP